MKNEKNREWAGEQPEGMLSTHLGLLRVAIISGDQQKELLRRVADMEALPENNATPQPVAGELREALEALEALEEWEYWYMYDTSESRERAHDMSMAVLALCSSAPRDPSGGLREYCRHKAGCEMLSQASNPECDCGLAAALAAAPKPRQESPFDKWPGGELTTVQERQAFSMGWDARGAKPGSEVEK